MVKVAIVEISCKLLGLRGKASMPVLCPSLLAVVLPRLPCTRSQPPASLPGSAASNGAVCATRRSATASFVLRRGRLLQSMAAFRCVHARSTCSAHAKCPSLVCLRPPSCSPAGNAGSARMWQRKCRVVVHFGRSAAAPNPRRVTSLRQALRRGTCWLSVCQASLLCLQRWCQSRWSMCMGLRSNHSEDWVARSVYPS